jgi:hypothetical protein
MELVRLSTEEPLEEELGQLGQHEVRSRVNADGRSQRPRPSSAVQRERSCAGAVQFAVDVDVSGPRGRVSPASRNSSRSPRASELRAHPREASRPSAVSVISPVRDPSASGPMVGPNVPDDARFRPRRAQMRIDLRPMSTGLAALARWRACALHARGRRFETRRAHTSICGGRRRVEQADVIAADAQIAREHAGRPCVPSPA